MHTRTDELSLRVRGFVSAPVRGCVRVLRICTWLRVLCCARAVVCMRASMRDEPTIGLSIRTPPAMGDGAGLGLWEEKSRRSGGALYNAGEQAEASREK